MLFTSASCSQDAKILSILPTSRSHNNRPNGPIKTQAKTFCGAIPYVFEISLSKQKKARTSRTGLRTTRLSVVPIIIPMYGSIITATIKHTLPSLATCSSKSAAEKLPAVLSSSAALQTELGRSWYQERKSGRAERCFAKQTKTQQHHY